MIMHPLYARRNRTKNNEREDDDNDDDDENGGDYRVFVQMKFAIYIEAANQICTTDDVTELTSL